MRANRYGVLAALAATLAVAPAIAAEASAGTSAPVQAPAEPYGPPTAGATPVAAPPVQPAPAAKPATPAAPATAAWLRQASRPAPKKLETRAGMSPWRVSIMLIAVAVLGGFAYYARRRKQAPTAQSVTEKLKVLGSTRVGPKAFAVVAEVGGKRLLLGVTEQAVNTLAWLEADAADVEERSEPARASRPAPVRRDADEAVQGPSGFLRLLRNAVGSAEGRGVAADEIAKQTRDEVTLSRRGKPEVTDELEGQVRGLARRRRDPS